MVKTDKSVHFYSEGVPVCDDQLPDSCDYRQKMQLDVGSEPTLTFVPVTSNILDMKL